MKYQSLRKLDTGLGTPCSGGSKPYKDARYLRALGSAIVNLSSAKRPAVQTSLRDQEANGSSWTYSSRADGPEIQTYETRTRQIAVATFDWVILRSWY